MLQMQFWSIAASISERPVPDQINLHILTAVLGLFLANPRPSDDSSSEKDLPKSYTSATVVLPVAFTLNLSLFESASSKLSVFWSSVAAGRSKEMESLFISRLGRPSLPVVRLFGSGGS